MITKKPLIYLLSLFSLFLFSCDKNFDNMEGYAEKHRSRNPNDFPKEFDKQPCIVIMGDGYTAYDMDKFRTDAENVEKYLFHPIEGVAPFNIAPFNNYFNVYFIFLVSEERGIGSGKAKNTVLRCFYNETDICFEDVNFFGGKKAPDPFSIAEQFVPGINLKNTIVVVLANDTREGYTIGYRNIALNGGDWISMISVSDKPDDFKRLVIREVGGKGFARLAQEDSYVSYELRAQFKTLYEQYGIYANIDIVSDKNQVRWSHFLDNPRYSVDVFANGNGAFCPNLTNIMYGQSGPLKYDAPSCEAIIKRIYSIHNWDYTLGTYRYYFETNSIVL